MKKIIFLLVLNFSLAAYGQVSIGLNGGVLIPAHTGYKYTSPHSAYKTGAEVLLKLSNKWKFRTGVDYTSFTFKRDFNDVDNLGNKIGVAHQYSTASYIGIPLGIRYEFKGRKINPFIDASISGMIKVSDNSKLENYHYSFFNEIYNDHPAKALSATSFLLSSSLGAGITYHPTEKLYLSFLLNYNLQMMPVYTYDSIRYNSISAVLSFGYQF